MENCLESDFNDSFADSRVESLLFTFTWKMEKPFLKCYIIESEDTSNRKFFSRCIMSGHV